MENHAESTYKLMILYMLNKAATPLTQEIFSGYIVEKGYTNFFVLQNAILELVDEAFIEKSSTYNNTYYELKPSGHDTFMMLKSLLSRDIQREIDEYLTEHQVEIVEMISTITDFSKAENGMYEAKVSLLDNKEPLLSLTLAVPTETDAIAVCNRFKEKKESIYQYLVRELL